jgi:hypothetical protein
MTLPRSVKSRVAGIVGAIARDAPGGTTVEWWLLGSRDALTVVNFHSIFRHFL